MNDYRKETAFDRQMRRKRERKEAEARDPYRDGLSRAAEVGRAEAILRATIDRGPLIRGTPEWDERERARAALGCQCLSFGDV